MGIKVTDISDKSKSLMQLLKKNKYILIALIAGIILLLIPWGQGESPESSQAMKVPEFALEEQEKKLAAILSKIAGAGKVTIALSLKSDIEQEIAWDEDISYKTGEDGAYEMDSKNSAVRLQTGSGYQSPITVKYIYPCYLGALVITESGSAGVRLQLTEAVAALTGLTTDKITVVQGK